MNAQNQLSTDQITLVAQQKYSMPGIEYLGTMASDQALKRLQDQDYPQHRPWGMVMNIDPISQSGSHWVALIRKRRAIELFDSYGCSGDKKFLQDYPHLEELLKHVTLITQPGYQSSNTYVCGHYCLSFFYCQARGQSLRKRFSLHPFSKRANDERICKFVCNTMITSKIRPKFERLHIASKGPACQGCCCQKEVYKNK